MCLDTEPKVINECLARSQGKEWKLDTKSVAYRHGGAGNNWAMGYQMCTGDFLETSIDLVRRELEMCDYPPLLACIHSGTQCRHEDFSL